MKKILAYIPGVQYKKQNIIDDHNTADIIDLVLKKDGQFTDQTDLFTEKIDGLDPYDQCHYIWQTLRDNVKYKPDPPENQELKSPARLFADGIGDCKSFSLFEASCLRNLNIPYAYRFVSFRPSRIPTHVYVIAFPGSKDQIIMDGVLSKFDYEKPYTHKRDVPMLSMLTGVDDHYVGAQNLFQKAGAALKKAATDVSKGVTKDVQQLQHSAQVNAANAVTYAKNPEKLATDAKKVVQDAMNTLNKVNPGAIALRTGADIAMSTNLMGAASKLKIGYLTPAQAQARGYNMSEWQKVVDQLNKWITMYKTWGGDPNVLKSNILKGGGQLNGIGYIPGQIRGGCLGVVAAAVGIPAAIAAITPILIVIVNDLAKVNLGGHSEGVAEQQFKKPGTMTADQLNMLSQGAAQLANDALNSGTTDPNRLIQDASNFAAQTASDFLPGASPAPGTMVMRKPIAPAFPRSDSSTLPLLAVGAAALYFMSRKN